MYHCKPSLQRWGDDRGQRRLADHRVEEGNHRLQWCEGSDPGVSPRARKAPTDTWLSRSYNKPRPAKRRGGLLVGSKWKTAPGVGRPFSHKDRNDRMHRRQPTLAATQARIARAVRNASWRKPLARRAILRVAVAAGYTGSRRIRPHRSFLGRWPAQAARV
jgi:hypothetical protein